MLNDGKLSVKEAMELYPEMSYTDSKGKTLTERANKYFIMLGEDGSTKGISLAERRLVRLCKFSKNIILKVEPNVVVTL